MQDVTESRKVSWFKLTDKCMGKKTIKNHKDSGKNTDNCQVAGSWCSKGAASVAWPHDTLFPPSGAENTDGTMDSVYTLL